MEYEFFYDRDNDILSVFRRDLKVKETVEFMDFLNLDLDKSGKVIGFEIFEASSFFKHLNSKVRFSLENLESVEVLEKDFRNSWFSILLLKEKNKKIPVEFNMPILSKSEYRSPLLVSN